MIQVRRFVLHVLTGAGLLLASALAHAVPIEFGAITPTIFAGDPGGTPTDSPANRVDANTTSSPYAGVGSLRVATAMGNGTCSGALVGRRHVLTAAHCVDIDLDGTPDVAPTDVDFILNYGSNQSHTITGSSFWFPATRSADFPFDDILLLELGGEAPAGVPVYEVFSTALVGPTQITMVGYGHSGDGVSGSNTAFASYNVKRVGQNVIDGVILDDDGSGLAELYLGDFDGPDGSTNSIGGTTLGNDVETTLGAGDSGGPAFVEMAGELLLVGVNTFVFNWVDTFGAGVNADPAQFGSGFGGVLISEYAADIQRRAPLPPSPWLLLPGLLLLRRRAAGKR